MVQRRPSGFVAPCQPSKVARPPSGPLWVHEIKHDGYRLMVRQDGLRVRCFTRNGHDWADRFPAIVDAAHRIKASSFLIDGEAVIARDDGTPDFHALRSRRRGHEAVLFAFDLIEHDGDDLRGLPLIERKRPRAILLSEHLTGDGPAVFEHVRRMGWRASCRNGRMRPIGADYRRRGSRRRTLPARRCAGSARRSGASLAQPSSSAFILHPLGVAFTAATSTT
jgi:bifunctional non-homologous end joining protein LigD